MKLIIRGGHAVSPADGIDKIADVIVENGKITAVSEQAVSGDDCEIIDASGKYVIPGLVDMHCHLRDPGQTYKEDIITGTRAALAGGITSVLCMPNTTPVADNETVISYIVNKAKDQGYVNVYPIGAISKGLEGKELAEIGSMKSAGAVAVSDDGHPVSDSSLMRRAVIYADMFDMPVISHCEDLPLANDGYMNEGAVSSELGLRGITRSAEEVMAVRDIVIAENENKRVHIAHVSTRGAVELIREAKKRGVKVTCETCPHYFSLTEEACRGFNTNAKMNPPLRTADDVEAIKDGLKDGTIDCIVTDHAPHSKGEKDCEFANAKNGIVGFETSLGLGIKYLVKTGVLTMNELIEKMAANPSKITGIKAGTLSVGADADITIFDADKEWTVDVNAFESKGKNSPYDKEKLFGKPECVMIGGKVKLKNGEII